MKILINKSTTIKKNSDDVVNYADIVKSIINSVEKRQWSPQEIRVVNRIFDVVESSNGELHFENEQAKYLTDLINSYGLPFRGKDAEQFLDDIDEMNKQK